MLPELRFIEIGNELQQTVGNLVADDGGGVSLLPDRR